MKAEFDRLVSALNALPDEAKVIDVCPRIKETGEGYIQIYGCNWTPDGPYTTEYHNDGTPEYSVKVNGVTVLWIGDKEVEGQ